MSPPTFEPRWDPSVFKMDIPPPSPLACTQYATTSLREQREIQSLPPAADVHDLNVTPAQITTLLPVGHYTSLYLFEQLSKRELTDLSLAARSNLTPRELWLALTEVRTADGPPVEETNAHLLSPVLLYLLRDGQSGQFMFSKAACATACGQSVGYFERSLDQVGSFLGFGARVGEPIWTDFDSDTIANSLPVNIPFGDGSLCNAIDRLVFEARSAGDPKNTVQ